MSDFLSRARKENYHILTFGFQIGSMFGTTIELHRCTSNYNPGNPQTFTCMAARILRSTGVGAVVWVAVDSVVTARVLVMSRTKPGQELVWTHQAERDNFKLPPYTYTGVALGLLGAIAIRRGLGWKGVIGVARVGS